MKYGFIGFGTMATMLIGSLLDFAEIEENDIAVSRRNKDKLTEVHEYFGNVQVFENNIDVVKNCQTIFLCVKPQDIKKVLLEVKDYLGSKKHVVYLAPTIPVRAVENITGGPVTKMVPSIISYVESGVSLVCHGSKVSDRRRRMFDKTIGQFSVVRETTEKDMALATILTSCMPGLIGAMFENLIVAAKCRSSSWSKKEIREILVETVLGTGLLVDEMDKEFSAVTKAVVTKGGLTAEGVKVFDSMLPDVYEELFDKVLTKWQESTENLTKEFSE